jgi:hypothetical protein
VNSLSNASISIGVPLYSFTSYLHLGVDYGKLSKYFSATEVVEKIEDKMDNHSEVSYLRDLKLVKWNEVETHYEEMIAEIADFDRVMNATYLNSIRKETIKEQQIYPTIQNMLDTVKRITDACGCGITGRSGEGQGTSADFCLVSDLHSGPIPRLRGVMEVKLFGKLFNHGKSKRDVVSLFKDDNAAICDAMHQVVGYCVKAGVKYGMLFSDDASYLFYVTLSWTEVTAHVSKRITRATLVDSLLHFFLCADSSDWKLNKK